ncbi:class I SAM-dependent rRNA methyltransferase [Acidithiobacillus sp.]|uniref:class I SAM-dependent rRNA methyltransferase n=1 Tax=Acidithiobacillus sp. TaxID=1872118 RepID=UPI0025BA1524|nr:class I SAM-dependent rRNA methyltransferase [Acidithiobacillus sp.]
MAHPIPPLRLKKNEDRRLRIGHPWIYSNEVDVGRTPLSGLTPGSVCRVEDHRGQPLGLAHVNPHALLCARLLTRNPEEAIDLAFYARRLRDALELRAAMFDAPFYRLVHGEGDGLPGLVVDRYGDHLVMQTGSAGMEQDLALIVAALTELLQPRGILLKGSGVARSVEGLPERIEVLAGVVPEHLEVFENGCSFVLDPRQGQKTGWFYDHRSNRQRLMQFAPGRRVLDLFSYLGGFALPLARAGAVEVLAVDRSAPALALLDQNARRNGLSQIRSQEGEALESLRVLRDRGESFDLIVLDPPALIKSRKDVREGTAAYARLNDLALRLLRPGGLLFTASCSYHLSRDALLQAIARGAARGSYRVLAEAGQDLDHPYPPAVPEARYLKAFLLRRAQSEEGEEDKAMGA